MQQTIRKSVSWLLTLAMIFSMLPGFTFTVLAAEHLCAHHTEHTADCGYEAGVSDCTYHCDICLEHDHGEPALHLRNRRPRLARAFLRCLCRTGRPPMLLRGGLR